LALQVFEPDSFTIGVIGREVGCDSSFFTHVFLSFQTDYLSAILTREMRLEGNGLVITELCAVAPAESPV
jgi:hypothetical protein